MGGQSAKVSVGRRAPSDGAGTGHAINRIDLCGRRMRAVCSGTEREREGAQGQDGEAGRALTMQSHGPQR